MTESIRVLIPQPETHEQRRYYRVERTFCNERHSRDMIKNLLRAHSTPT